MEIVEGIVFSKLKYITRNAGEILRDGFYNCNKKIDEKKARELVTNYDYESEKYIINQLKQYDIPIIAEETKKNYYMDKNKCWVIDPIDGTNNFAFGIPHFSVVIALIWENEIVFGIIHDPIKNETFYSIKNRGAFLNDEKIKVSSRKKLSKAMVATGFSYNRGGKNGYNNINNFKNFALKARGIRRLGSAALDLAYVGAGRYDVYWEEGLKIWDMAAGKLFVEESGGKITDLNGKKWLFNTNNIVASNGIIHEKVISSLEKYNGRN